MPEDITPLEAKLKKLATHVRTGRSIIHTPSERDIATARAAILEEWNLEHPAEKQKPQSTQAATAQESKAQEATQSQEKPQQSQSESGKTKGGKDESASQKPSHGKDGGHGHSH